MGFTTVVNMFKGPPHAFEKLPPHVQAKFLKVVPLEFDLLEIDEVGGDSIITLGAQDSITVRGVTGLDETDFLFA